MHKSLFVSFLLVFATAAAQNNLYLRDLDGNFLTFPSANRKGLVVFFADTHCPVANRYIPKMNDLYANYFKKGIDFIFSYSDASELWSVARHINEYKIQPPAVIDTDRRLTDLIHPKVLSEVAVFDASMNIVYQGRIDDQYAVGQNRVHPSTQELKNVLEVFGSGSAPAQRFCCGKWLRDIG